MKGRRTEGGSTAGIHSRVGPDRKSVQGKEEDLGGPTGEQASRSLRQAEGGESRGDDGILRVRVERKVHKGSVPLLVDRALVLG